MYTEGLTRCRRGATTILLTHQGLASKGAPTDHLYAGSIIGESLFKRAFIIEHPSGMIFGRTPSSMILGSGIIVALEQRETGLLLSLRGLIGGFLQEADLTPCPLENLYCLLACLENSAAELSLVMSVREAMALLRIEQA